MITSIILTAYGIGIFLCVFFVIRSEFVYKARIDQIDKSYDTYKAGKSYYSMLFQVHKWTRRQFYGDKP
jgi:hypothetical protein